MTENRLAVSLPGLNLKNPVMPSSGAFYYGLDHMKDFDLNELGALVLKTTTVDERKGNPQPWVVPAKAGVLNSVGLANPGVKKVTEEIMPELAEKLPDLPQMISVAGESVNEYVELVKAFNEQSNIDAIEINLSCPNVDKGGLEFGVDPESAAEVIAACRKVTDKPIYAKLSPNVTDIKPIAKAVEDAGADGIVLINTVLGMSIDLNTRKPKLFRGQGGLSGKAVHEIAVRFVYEAAKTVKIPVIGVGGIETVDDIIEFLVAGASAVQVGMANASNPLIMPKLIKQLPAALDMYNFATVQDAIGAVQENH